MAYVFKRSGISFINLGIGDVTCEANSVILKIPEGCAPYSFTSILGFVSQNGESKSYAFYIANGNLSTDLKLTNAYILVTGIWKSHL